MFLPFVSILMGFILNSFSNIALLAIDIDVYQKDLIMRNRVDGFSRECVETVSEIFARQKGYFQGLQNSNNETINLATVPSWANDLECDISFKGLETQNDQKRFSFIINIQKTNTDTSTSTTGLDFNSFLPQKKTVQYMLDSLNSIEGIFIRN